MPFSLTLRLFTAAFVILFLSGADAGGKTPTTSDASGKIAGFVLDEEGKPIPGAKVEVIFISRTGGKHPTSILRGEELNVFRTYTDDDGRFTIHGLPRHGTATLRISCAGYAPKRGDMIRIGSDNLHFVLLPGGRIEGRVTFGDGTPAEGVKVICRDVAGIRRYVEAVTDGDGRYRIADLPEGSYTVRVASREPVPEWTAAAHIGVRVEGGGVADGIDFVLTKGGLVMGRVTDSGTGRPVPGAIIAADGEVPCWHAATDEEGRYVLRLPPGRWCLSVGSAEGYAFYESSGTCIEVREGDIIDGVDWELSPAPQIKAAVSRPSCRIVSVSGGVVDRDGNPLEGAEIWAYAFPGPSCCCGPVSPVFAAVEGSSFALSGLPEGECFLFGILPDAGLAGYLGIEAYEDTSGVVLRLDEVSAVEGRAVDENGDPVAGAMAELMLWLESEGGGCATFLPVGGTTSGMDGHFSFEKLFPGCAYEVSVTAEGRWGAESDRVSLSPGERFSLGDIVLESATGVIGGTLKDEDGNPVSGARVYVQGGWMGPVRETLSDGEGRYMIGGLPERRRLRIEASCYREGKFGWRVVRVGDRNADILMRSVEEPERPSEEGRIAPELSVSLWVNSAPMRLEKLRGKVVYLDFWSVNCGPCVASIPRLEDLQRRYRDSDLVIIAIHDSWIKPAELRRFIEEHGITYPVAIDSRSPEMDYFNSRTFAKYKVRGIPRTFLIDRKGRIRYRGSIDALLSEGL